MPATDDTLAIGKTLVKRCNAGDFRGAIDACYADDIVSVEAADTSKEGREVRGIAAVRAKTTDWEQDNEIHSCEVRGPFPHDNRFCAMFDMDVTPKSGPMGGQRIHMQEVALYTVKDGKIAREEFFYNIG